MMMTKPGLTATKDPAFCVSGPQNAQSVAPGSGHRQRGADLDLNSNTNPHRKRTDPNSKVHPVVMWVSL